MTEQPSEGPETRIVVNRVTDGQGNVLSEETKQVPVQPEKVDAIQQLQDAVTALGQHQITDPALQAVADAVKALAATQRQPKPRR